MPTTKKYAGNPVLVEKKSLLRADIIMSNQQNQLQMLLNPYQKLYHVALYAEESAQSFMSTSYNNVKEKRIKLRQVKSAMKNLGTFASVVVGLCRTHFPEGL